MSHEFKCVGLVGLPRQIEAMETHKLLYQWLNKKGYCVFMEDQVAIKLGLPSSVSTASLTEIANLVDLVIVIGGDGNMLRAARAFINYDIKVIGIHRGSLGFLTDIVPEEAIVQIEEVLNGHYICDTRSVLEVEVRNDDIVLYSTIALNEVVLHPDKIAHMINFSVDINYSPAFSQRADGLIIATPTGSTAYSLSAGGPILEPSLDAIVITPMFPHSLSIRPLVINGHSIIHVRNFLQNVCDLEVSCDSQVSLPVKKGNNILVKQSKSQLNLIHTRHYDYFNTLSLKLGWSKKLF